MPLIKRLLSKSVSLYNRCSSKQLPSFRTRAAFYYASLKIDSNYPYRTYSHESSTVKSTEIKKEIDSNSSTIPNHDTSSSSSSSEENSDSEELEQEERLHYQILEAALPFVKEYGWTTDAIARGAETLGYSKMIHGMFDKGGTDLVNYFYSNCNSRLENELQNLVEAQKNEEKKLSTTNFIRTAVEIRLRMNAPYIDSWAKALVLHASPANLSSAFNNFGTLIDTIWYYAGDRSHDFNWYTKRAVLAGIYKSAELCMLQDTSQDFQETWAFLDRRLSELELVSNCAKQMKEKTKDLSNILDVGFITIQNMCGLNKRSRS